MAFAPGCFLWPSFRGTKIAAMHYLPQMVGTDHFVDFWSSPSVFLLPDDSAPSLSARLN